MTRTTLLAPLVAVALTLAACGGDDPSTVEAPSPSSTSSTDTQSVESTGSPADDGSADLRPPTPIVAESGSASGAGRAGTTEAAGSAEIASDDMMIAPFVAEYVLGDSLPPLPTDDVGYVFDGSLEASPESVTQLAAALGVPGEPTRDAEAPDAWSIGPRDGTAPNLVVWNDATQSWSYSGPWAESALAEPCVVTDDAASGDCAEPAPPPGVPGAAEAEQRSRDLLAALGLDPAALTLEVFADEWSANVTADDRTPDRPALRYWNFGFGADGVLQWAGGSLATPERVGPYPLVDLDTALQRLRDRGVGLPMPRIDAEIAEPGEVTIDVATATTDPVEPADEADETVETVVADEPMPVEPGIDAEAVTVTLVDVQPDLWWVWDADGNAWLVPAYRFVDTEGGWHTVPAVTDEFLVQAEPALEPIPVEPDDGTGGGAEPLPPPESLPLEPDEPVVDAPVDDPAAALATLEEFVGLSIEEFTAEAEALGYTTRVVVRDGEPLAVTEDFSPTRVNVEVEGPRVVALDSMG